MRRFLTTEGWISEIGSQIIFTILQILLWANVLIQTGGGNLAIQITTRQTIDGTIHTYHHTEVMNMSQAILIVAASFLLIQLVICAVSYHHHWNLGSILIPVYAMCDLGLLLKLAVGSYSTSAPDLMHTSFVKGYIFLIIGLVTMILFIFLSCLPEGRSAFVAVASALFLAAVAAFFLAASTNGSRTWIYIGGLSIQPSEFLKAIDIILLSIGYEQLKTDRRCRIIFTVVWFSQILLLLAENDTGDSLILLALGIAALAVFSLRGAILAALSGAGMLILLVTFGGLLPEWFPVNVAHIIERFTNVGNVLFNTEARPQLRHLLLAVCRSGMLGTGLRGSDYLYQTSVYAADSDLAFLTITATFGIGAVLILLFALVILIVHTSYQLKNVLGMQHFLIRLCTLTIVLEAVVHIGGNLTVLPLTGVPLPFISTGGSALVSNFALVGVLLGNTLPEEMRRTICLKFREIFRRGPAGRLSRLTDQLYNRLAVERIPEKIRRTFSRWTLRRRVAVLAAVILIPILACHAVIGAYAPLSLSRGSFSSDVDNSAGLSANELEAMDGFEQIALFGLDNRSDDETTGRSDTIIIAFINRKTCEVKLVSVFRDTLLEQGSGSLNTANATYNGSGSLAKANAAYNSGAEAAVSMLNRNLDLNITNYVTVDWAALVEIIDDLGGLDLEISEEERADINYRLQEVIKMSGVESEEIAESGKVHLNGCQAVGYARIRKTSGDDFHRSGRQQTVLKLILQKARKAGPLTLLKLIRVVQRHTNTSLKLSDILALALRVSKYSLTSTGFPAKLTTAAVEGCGSSVIPATLASNVSTLHCEVFGDDTYDPSATVKEISARITELTGVDTATETRSDVLDYFEE